MAKKYFNIFFVLLALAGCNEPGSSTLKSSAPKGILTKKIDFVDANWISVAWDGVFLRARGFSGAVPPNATVRLNHTKIEVVADNHGRFDFTTKEVDIPKEVTLSFSHGSQTVEIPWKVRHLGQDLNALIMPRIRVDTEPGDMRFSTNAEEKKLYSVGDDLSRLSEIYYCSKSKEYKRTRPELNLEQVSKNENARHSLTFSENGEYGAITTKSKHTVTLFQLSNFEVTHTFSDEGLISPTASSFWGEKLMVAYSDEAKGITNNGLVAVFTIESRKLRLQATAKLESVNPSTFVFDNKNNPWVITSGQMALNEQGSIAVLSDGALSRLTLNGQKFETAQNINLKRIRPGIPTFVNDRFYIPSLAGPDLYDLSPRAKSIDEAEKIVIGEAGDKIPSITFMGGDLLVIPSYKSNSLFVYDIVSKELNPWPFSNGIVFQDANAISDLPTRVATNQNPDFRADLYILLSASSQVLPIDLSAIFGPKPYDK